MWNALIQRYAVLIVSRSLPGGRDSKASQVALNTFRRRKGSLTESFHLVSNRPFERNVLRTLGLLIVLAAAGLGFWFGSWRADLDTANLQSLIRRDRASEEIIATLRRQLIDAELARAVDRQAATSLRSTIAGLRDELAEQRDEAALYRNMVSPKRGGSDLRVVDFEVGRVEGNRAFRFYLLLTRPSEPDEVVRGTAQIEIRGTVPTARGRQQRILSLPDLGSTLAYPVPFRFRYFQTLAGDLELPVDFEPTRVLVRLYQGGRRDPVRLEYAWTPVAM